MCAYNRKYIILKNKCICCFYDSSRSIVTFPVHKALITIIVHIRAGKSSPSGSDDYILLLDGWCINLRMNKMPFSN